MGLPPMPKRVMPLRTCGPCSPHVRSSPLRVLFHLEPSVSTWMVTVGGQGWTWWDDCEWHSLWALPGGSWGDGTGTSFSCTAGVEVHSP